MMVRNSALVKHLSEILRELIGVRLREERERLGLSQEDFAAIGGASRRSQIDWEQGKFVPNVEFLAAVAGEGVDVLYVLTGQRTYKTLTDEEKDLIKGFNALDQVGKAGVVSLIRGMIQASQGTDIHFSSLAVHESAKVYKVEKS